MEYIISAVWTFLELVGFCLFSNAFMEKKQKSGLRAAMWLLVWFVMFAYSRLGLTSPIQQIGILLIYLVTSYLFYCGRLLHRILIVVVYVVFAGAIDTIMVYGTSILTGISFSELIWRKLTYVVVVTSGKLLTVFISFITRSLRERPKEQLLRNNWLFLTILFPAVSYIVLVITFRSYINEDDLSLGAIVLCGILVGADIATIYMIRQLERSTRRERETLLLNQRMEMQTQSIIDLEKSYRVQRQASHDFHRHLQAIRDLLEMNKGEDALSYLRKLQGEQSIRVLCANSHHPIIDAILNQKYQQAKEKKIEMQIQISDLSEVTIATEALVVLLSNLLDNAIEACVRKQGQRIIHCCVDLGDALFLSVRNTSLPVVMVNGKIQTSKAERRDHGFGLANICRVLNGLNAEYTYGYEDGWFLFSTEIPLAVCAG